MMNILRSTTDWAKVCEELTQKNERLTNQAAALIAQNGYLRKANKVRPHVKLIEKAVAGAKLLAVWHVAGWLTGRESCREYGMTESYFYAGRALLVLAGLHSGDTWLTDDPDRIEAKLKMAIELGRKRPEMLAQNIPNSRRPRAYQDDANDFPFGRSPSR